MRTSILMLAVPVACMAQAPAAKLTVDAVHHDFGRISQDRKVTHLFKLVNKGNAPLQIRHLNPSCGCTSTVVGQWYLKPGEGTEVEATFNPAGFRGKLRKSIQVISDDPQNPTLVLSFEAEVIQEIVPETTALFFREIAPRGVHKRTVRLHSENGQKVDVKEVKAPGAPYLVATWRNEGLDAVVDLSLDTAKLPYGVRENLDKITIRTGNPRMAYIPIDVSWDLASVFTCSPERVAWVEAAGKEHRTQLVIKHVKGKPFRITAAFPSRPQLRVEGLNRPAAATQTLWVVADASLSSGSYGEHIDLNLDDPDQPQIRIRVSAVLN